MEIDKKGGFKSFGEYLRSVRRACIDGIEDGRLKTTGHSETGVDYQGGFTVPEEWADEIMSVGLETAIVRPRAQVIKTNRDSLKVRRIVESTRASTLYGGITFTWAAEAADKKSFISTPKLGELELTAHKLIGGCYVSNELMADYDNFGAFMTQAFGQALRFEEDYIFIWGSGAGQPLGIMNSGALIQTARRTYGPIGGGVDIADIGFLAGRLLPACWANAVWLVHPSVFTNFDNAAGANTSTIYNLADMACLGRPVIFTDKCIQTPAVGDIILADFSHYVIADRGLEISASSEATYDTTNGYGFLTDETFWRVVLRVDGQPIMAAPITPRNGTNTQSAFVTLKAES